MSTRGYRLHDAGRLAHGFPASSHDADQLSAAGTARTVLPLRAASARSMPATLAIVVSQASTSANSAACSSCVPSRKAAANSPTSSISHMNVPSTPRARSFSRYISRISRWKSLSESGAEGTVTRRASCTVRTGDDRATCSARAILIYSTLSPGTAVACKFSDTHHGRRVERRRISSPSPKLAQFPRRGGVVPGREAAGGGVQPPGPLPRDRRSLPPHRRVARRRLPRRKGRRHLSVACLAVLMPATANGPTTRGSRWTRLKSALSVTRSKCARNPSRRDERSKLRR